jgi:hypothetical protein
MLRSRLNYKRSVFIHDLLQRLRNEIIERIELLPDEALVVEKRSDDHPAIFLGDGFFFFIDVFVVKGFVYRNLENVLWDGRTHGFFWNESFDPGEGGKKGGRIRLGLDCFLNCAFFVLF